MQALVKSPPRIKKFVPHSGSSGADPIRTQADRAMPALKSEGFDQLAHDTRNVLSALKLYCDLLAEPGVLSATHSHYAPELQAVTDTAVRLVERLAAPRRANSRRTAVKSSPALPEEVVELRKPQLDRATDAANSWPVDGMGDLGRELLSMRPLLTAMAGPRIELEMESLPCGGRTRISKEDLTRVLLNLVRNASEAMPEGGKVRITAQYDDGLSFVDLGQVPEARPHSVVITVEDNGPGIPEELREEVFKAGFTTRAKNPKWPAAQHRGLGLSIVRGLIEAAGGTACVSTSPHRGARFELVLPITSGMYEITDNCGLVADSALKGCIECR
jgi:signal transduction histidine kinase